MKLIKAAVAVAAVLALAACTSAPSATKSSATQTATPTPTATSSLSAQVPVTGGLSLAAGNDLTADRTKAPTFANKFSDPDSGWTEQEGTDATAGHFVYNSADGLCTVTLSQIVIGTNFTITKNDDSATSDAALVWYFRDSPNVANQVNGLVADAALPLGSTWKSGDPGAEFRGFVAEASDGTILAAYARAFGVPGVVLYLDLTCQTSDAFTANSQDALLDATVLTF